MQHNLDVISYNSQFIFRMKTVQWAHDIKILWVKLQTEIQHLKSINPHINYRFTECNVGGFQSIL